MTLNKILICTRVMGWVIYLLILMNVIILWIDESVHEVLHPALVAVVGAVGG